MSTPGQGHAAATFFVGAFVIIGLVISVPGTIVAAVSGIGPGALVGAIIGLAAGCIIHCAPIAVCTTISGAISASLSGYVMQLTGVNFAGVLLGLLTGAAAGLISLALTGIVSAKLGA